MNRDDTRDRLPLRVLIVEDSEDDALLLLRELRREGYEPDHLRVDSAQRFRSSLAKANWDVVLSDFSMPHFDGMQAYHILRDSGLDVPFVFVSGRIGEDRAVEAMRGGVADYILKDNLRRLGPAVTRELGEAEQRRRRRRADAELLRSAAKFRGLAEGSIQGIVVHRDFRPLYMNRAYAGIHGYAEPEELLRWESIVPLFAQGERERLQAYCRERIRGGRVPERYQYRVQRADSSVRWVENNVTVIDWDGEPAILSTIVDISDLKRREAELAESEGRLRDLVEGSIQGILVHRNFAPLFANQAYAAMFGYDSPREVMGLESIVGTFAPEERERVAEFNRWRLEGREVPTQYTFHGMRRDGSRIWVEVLARRITWQGEPALQATHFDITERRQAEERLRRSEEYHRAIIDNTLDVIAVIDEGTVVRDVSPSVRDILGYEPEEVIGRDSRDLVHAEDLPRVLEAWDYERRHPGSLEEIEFRLRHRDGSWRIVESRGRNLTDNPAIRGVVASYRDVTERRRAEEELRANQRLLQAIFDSLPVWVTVGDERRRNLMMNRHMQEVIGIAAEDYLGRTPEELPFGSAQEQRHLAELDRECLQTGRTVETPELPITLPDGRSLTVSMVRTPLRDEHGAISGLLVVGQDITESKALARQLQHAQRMEAIARLAGGIAHDFNNMLAIIVSYAGLLRDHFAADEPAREDLGEIEEAANRGTALTRQLLTFSRRQSQELMVLHLNEVIEGLQRMLQRLIGEDIHLVTRLAPELGRIKADHSQLEQILLNLVVNARDAMPEGGRIVVETRDVELDEDYTRVHFDVSPGPYVMLAVSDTGVGMDTETRHKVFDPFFSTKEWGKGTGLGLATVYGIVKQTGGDIWIDSEPGRGATFHIYFPRTEELLPEERLERAGVDTLEGRETLLLVEDDGQVRKAARRILERAGYTLLEAADGNAALQLAEAHPDRIDLMVTDVVMPEMSGPELADRLAGIRPELRVVYMSGYTENTIVQRGVSTGEIHLIQKPFERESLLRKVRQALRRE